MPKNGGVALQRLQFDLGEQISRKEYLKRKRKRSKILRKRSKITYMLLCIFMALSIYIVIQLFIYKKYNSFKYVEGENVAAQAVYDIFFVTEGYTYDPVYSVNKMESSGDKEENILPSSNYRKIDVTEDSIYGIKDKSLWKINKKSYESVELIKDNVKKYIPTNEYIFYTSTNDKKLKSYNIETTEIKEFDLAGVEQLIVNDTYLFAVANNSIYRLNYDGQDKKKISKNANVSYAIEKDNIIYFVNRDDSNKIYRVDCDGNEMYKVADIKGVDGVSSVNGQKYMFVKDNNLYYINPEDDNTLWRYNMENGENDKIISSSVEILQNVDDTIFYKINKEMGVYLYNYKTNFLAMVTKRRVKEFVIDTYNLIDYKKVEIKE